MLTTPREISREVGSGGVWKDFLLPVSMVETAGIGEKPLARGATALISRIPNTMPEHCGLENGMTC